MTSTLRPSRSLGRGDVRQRLADGVVMEFEAGPLQCGGDCTLPAEEPFGGELAEHSPQREAGHRSGVGRFTARPSAAVNSALVTGAGPVPFTGPARSSCPSAN